MNKYDKHQDDIKKSILAGFEKAVYKDTAENRKAGRVGQKFGGGKKNISSHKEGELPRGAVGHTKSGKPIMKQSDNKKHADFTAQDHRDASKVHKDSKKDRAKGKSYGKTVDGEPMYRNRGWSDAHWNENAHDRAANTMDNADNKEAIAKVKKHAEDKAGVFGGSKIHANAHGYHIRHGETAHEYDKEGNHTGSVPSSFYSGTTSHIGEHKHVATTGK